MHNNLLCLQYDNVSAVMVMYDVTRRDTFHSTAKWLQCKMSQSVVFRSVDNMILF
jgi:GTPase SAR1 family protein